MYNPFLVSIAVSDMNRRRQARAKQFYAFVLESMRQFAALVW